MINTAREYVPIFFDWLDTTQDLSPEEKGNLIDAVVSYAAGQEYDKLLSGGCRIAFRFLKGQVDRNAELSEIRSASRRNKTEQTITNDNKTEQTTTKPNKTEQTTTKSPKEKEKEKERDKENDKEREGTGRFAPPTIAQVIDYCRERGNNVDPQRFVDYYCANGWKVGKNPMKDWRAAVRTWEQDSGKAPARSAKTVLAQQYEQRDYSGTDDSLLSVLSILQGDMAQGGDDG